MINPIQVILLNHSAMNYLDEDHHSRNAIDGDVETYFANAEGTKGAWWKAHFPTSGVKVKKVQVTMPKDSAHAAFASNAKVYIGSKLCGKIVATPEIGKVYTLMCDLVGDYVNVVTGMTGASQRLAMAKIEVFSNQFKFVIKDSLITQYLGAKVEDLLTYNFVDTAQDATCKPQIKTSFIGKTNSDPGFYDWNPLKFDDDDIECQNLDPALSYDAIEALVKS